jgi:hypothetical protein
MPSKTRLVLMLIGALLFVAIGLWMVGAFGEPPRPRGLAGRLTWVGWIGIPFFGLAAVAIAAKLRDKSAQLVIDGRGILWRPWSDSVIPWSEVERIEERQIARQTMFAVYLRDPTLCPPTRWTGKLSARQRGFGMGDMSLTLSGTDRNEQELRDALTRFCPGSADTM